MRIDYQRYRDQVHGGWLGKCIGGTIGARFEGRKSWIDCAPEDFFPERVPPNDDLDLQVLWLKVLEERGLATTAVDLADAWLEHCWYPFNEYGVFRRNWRIGIHPPTSGSFQNPFWGTGMGCPIRSEIWGYVFPGDPERAAHYAAVDGSLDHTAESVGAEQLYAAMAAMAFLEDDLLGLVDRFAHFLPAGSPIARLTALAREGMAEGLPLPAIRDRILAAAPCAEACDARINVPFTILGLLAGAGDPALTAQRTLALGYDTDCTLATALAFLGQIAGASALPASLTGPIGDELVMGIAYRREEMTISALTRDTVRLGVRFASSTGAIVIDGAPADGQPAETSGAATWQPVIEHLDAPSAAPGDTVRLRLSIRGDAPVPLPLQIDAPSGWTVACSSGTVEPGAAVIIACTCAADIPELPLANRFTLRLGDRQLRFGIKGAELWRLLRVAFSTRPLRPLPEHGQRREIMDNFIDPDAVVVDPQDAGDELFEDRRRELGVASVIPARELILRDTDLSPLDTAWQAVIERQVVSTVERDVFLCVGHDCPLRIWLNGAAVGRDPGPASWSPHTSAWPVRLRAGVNVLRVQLTRTGAALRFSLGIAEDSGRDPRRGSGTLHRHDHCIDLADRNPLVVPAPV